MKAKPNSSAWVDPDDAPAWNEADFAKAEYRIGDEPASREQVRAAVKARGGRPKAEKPKVSTNIRLDQDVLDVLRATGPGWQTRVNTILRERFAL